MEATHRFIRSLLRLNDLEGSPAAPWTKELTKAERRLAIDQARRGLPTYLLGHHDRMLARGKRSVCLVRGGICSACHMKLPTGHHRRQAAKDLDVCDYCGVFLVWDNEGIVARIEPGDFPPGPAPSRRRKTPLPARA